MDPQKSSKSSFLASSLPRDACRQDVFHGGDAKQLTAAGAAVQIGAEITIDVCCATVAEVRKRGEKFWGEFEFYLSDLAVGMVLDIVLVTLLAPVAVIGKYPKAVESTGALRSSQQRPLGAGARAASSASTTLACAKPRCMMRGHLCALSDVKSARQHCV